MSSFTPSSRSLVLSTYGYVGDVDRFNQDLAPRLARISAWQVHSGADMPKFIETVKRSVEDERGKLDATTLASVTKMASDSSGISDPLILAPYFSKLKAGATSVGAPQTAAAIAGAAKWFWENVEKPVSPVASASGGGGRTAADAGADAGASADADKFYKKPWFPFAVVGGVLAVGILTYALWPSKT